MNENNFKIKATAKEQGLTQNGKATFNQHKFISDIYECEKQLYIFKSQLIELLRKRTVGPTDFSKDFKESIEYKKKNPIPKEAEKPDTLFANLVNVPMCAFLGVVGGGVLDIIIDIIKKELVFAPGFYVLIFSIIVGFVISVVTYSKDKHKYQNSLNQIESVKKQNLNIDKHNNERYKYWDNEYYNKKQLARKKLMKMSAY